MMNNPADLLPCLMPDPTLLADYRCICGEAPTWHPQERRLYWTDNASGKFFYYEPDTGRHGVAYEGRIVGTMALQADGSLLLFMDRGSIAVWSKGAIERFVIDEIPSMRRTRFNEAFVTPQGRVYVGSMPTPGSLKPTPNPDPSLPAVAGGPSPDDPDADGGTLYRLEHDGSIAPVMTGIGCINGMGLSLDQRTFFQTDSVVREIYAYDFDPVSETLGNKRLWTRLSEPEGLPDGLSLDQQGMAWSARYFGGCIAAHDASGKAIGKIRLPVPRVTSLCFAGDDAMDVYITTAAGRDLTPPPPAMAGGLFKTRASRPGREVYRSRIGC